MNRETEMSELILQEHRDGVLLLTFNRPNKKNALTNESFALLRSILDQAQANKDVRVVVLTGAGGNFSAGADLSSSGGIVDDAPGEGLDKLSAEWEKCGLRISRFEKPIIAAMSGIAVGGGVTLTFHCDLVYVSESVKMRLPFVALGIVPELASSYVLAANIGRQRAAELLFTAKWVNADQAVEFGLAREKFSDDELLSKVLEKAAEIAQWPVGALVASKKLINAPHADAIEAAFLREHDAMLKQTSSPEHNEAIMAFLEKRPANFHDL